MSRTDVPIVTGIDRRGFLTGGAGVVLCVATGGAGSLLHSHFAAAQSPAAAAAGVAFARGIAPEELDTWLTIDSRGGVTAYFGKMDMGQGVDTAIAQVVAEELDVAIGNEQVVMGDTHRTPNQGGASVGR